MKSDDLLAQLLQLIRSDHERAAAMRSELSAEEEAQAKEALNLHYQRIGYSPEQVEEVRKRSDAFRKQAFSPEFAEMLVQKQAKELMPFILRARQEPRFSGDLTHDEYLEAGIQKSITDIARLKSGISESSTNIGGRNLELTQLPPPPDNLPPKFQAMLNRNAEFMGLFTANVEKDFEALKQLSTNPTEEALKQTSEEICGRLDALTEWLKRQR